MKYIVLSDNKKWYSSYSVLFCLCVACVLFISITHIIGNSMIKILGIAIYMFIMIACDKNMVLPLLLFFLPWIDIIKLSPDSISFSSVVTLLLIVKYIYEGWRIETKEILKITAIALLTLLSKLFHGYEVSTSYIMFFATMVLYDFILSNEKEKIQFDKCTYFYASGLILAALTAVIFQNSENISAYIQVQKSAHILRVTGFVGDANFYSAQILPAFAGVFLLIWQNNHRIKGDILLAIGLAAVGLIAVSKSFIVCLVMVVGCYVLSESRKDKKNLFIFFSVGVTMYFIISKSGIFSDTIDAYTTRFNTSSDMKELTTGRDLIWKNYLSFFYNKPFELLLGQGLTQVFNIVYKGSHNTIIQSLYQFGLVGSIILFFWSYTLTKAKKPQYQLWIKLLWIIGCFSMWMGLDLLFFDDFFCILTFFAVGVEAINNTRKNDKNGIKTHSRPCRYIR